MNNILKKTGRWAYYIVIVCIILFTLNSIISRSDKIFNIVGLRTYTVLTGSMEPKIMPGDLAVVKAVDKNSLDVDDVITFRYEGYVVTHRIIEKEDEGFITKGDNNNVEDADIVKKEDVIGKVITVIPKLGHFMAFVSKPFVLVGLLILLALLILKETFFDDENSDKNTEGKHK